MTEFERLATKLDENKKDLNAALEAARNEQAATRKEQSDTFGLLFEKLGALQLDMAVLKTQRSSSEREVVALRGHVDHEVNELKGRMTLVEQKQQQAAIWRAWMMGAAAALGAVGGKIIDWMMGRH